MTRIQEHSPAQQFYNDKCSWRELELVKNLNMIANPLISFRIISKNSLQR